MKITVVIPARQKSSRFPNKPLAMIQNKSLIQRVWETAKQVSEADEVIVATDHVDILTHVQKFGGHAVMTRAECRNGSERAWDVIRKEEGSRAHADDLVINLQGDALGVPSWILSSLIQAMKENSDWGIGTPAYVMTEDHYQRLLQERAKGITTGTLVVTDLKGRALYFSKSPIPFIRPSSRGFPTGQILRHLGIYAYRYWALEKYASYAPTPLEEIEQLEQLRALENGMAIHTHLIDSQGREFLSIDHPEDLIAAEKALGCSSS